MTACDACKLSFVDRLRFGSQKTADRSSECRRLVRGSVSPVWFCALGSFMPRDGAAVIMYVAIFEKYV